MTTKKLIFFFVLFAFCFSQSVNAQELWYDAYEKGIRALRSGDLATAEAKLKTALSRRSSGQEKRVKTYGMNRIDYFPDYYLGVVYFKQGRYAEAAKQFQRAEEMGLASEDSKLFAEMKETQQELERKLAPKTAEPTQPPAPPAGPTADQLLAQKRKQDAQNLIRDANAFLDQERIADAKRALEAARENDPENTSIATVAGRIAQKEQELRTKQLQAEADQKKTGEFQQAIAEAEQALARNDFATAKTQLQKAAAQGIDSTRVNKIRQAITVSETTDLLENAIALQQWARAEELLRRLNSVDPRNPAIKRYRAQIARAAEKASDGSSEQQALVAFYSGDYATARDLLMRLSGEKKDSAKIRFYLGCATAAIALMTAGQDQEKLLKEASRYFSEARRMNPRLAFDSRNISPRILRIYERS